MVHLFTDILHLADQQSITVDLEAAAQQAKELHEKEQIQRPRGGGVVYFPGLF